MKIKKINNISIEEYLYLKGYLKSNQSLYKKTKNKKGESKFAEEVFEFARNNDLISFQNIMKEINEINARLKNGISWQFLVEEYKKNEDK
jgi:hypothetical protein